jgi:hypothetical protein
VGSVGSLPARQWGSPSSTGVQVVGVPAEEWAAELLALLAQVQASGAYGDAANTRRLRKAGVHRRALGTPCATHPPPRGDPVPDHGEPNGDEQDGKQVSEVSGMDPVEADDKISPGDATAGSATEESGETQEGTAGPNAAPRHDPPEPGNKSSR